MKRVFPLREPLKIHFGGQANIFDSGRRQKKQALASARPDFSSLPEYKNILLAAQKQLLELPLSFIVGLTILIGYIDIYACDSCYHECHEYVKTIKDYEEPARSIALALWFGTYSSETFPDASFRDPAKWMKGGGNNIEPDEKIREYFKFWNSHSKHVPKVIKGYTRREEMAIPLPGKGATVFWNIGNIFFEREDTELISLPGELLVRRLTTGESMSVKLRVRLHLVKVIGYGGKLEDGIGFKGKPEPITAIDAEIKLKKGKSYNLKTIEHIKNHIAKKININNKFMYSSAILQVTTLEEPANKSILALSKKTAWLVSHGNDIKIYDIKNSDKYSAISALIDSLPNADYLPKEYRLPEGVSPMGQIPAEKDKEVKTYHENIAELSIRYEILKKELRPGKSILNFPGLMAKGYIRYDQNKKRYHMNLGVYDRIVHAGSQGVFGPYSVIFDINGKIIQVRDLVYKN